MNNSLEKAIEIEVIDDEEDIQNCIKLFDNTVDSLNFDPNYG